MAFDSKEYTRLRDIAQKRIKRAASQGIAPAVHVPTVREIKAGIVDPGQAMRELKRFISGGSTVTAIKQTGLVPEFREFPQLPPKRKLSSEEQKARKRTQNRLYRMRQRIIKQGEKEGISLENIKKRVHYLYAMKGWTEKYKQAGRKPPIDLSELTPKEAEAFSAYMEMRFSQGDYTAKYVIDVFTEEFVNIRKTGYDVSNIVNDFYTFLEKQYGVHWRGETMEGIDSATSAMYIKEFIGGL